MIIRFIKTIGSIGAVCMFSFLLSCNSLKKTSASVLYFQNHLDSSLVVKFKERIVQTGDLLSIQIISNSLNQEQTLLFNLPNTSNNNISGYMVDASGNIELPIIGSIRAVSLTKVQLETLIESKAASYIKQPVVLAKFNDFKVNVMGEVKLPGIQSFQKDRVTVIDALSSAGDLTDYGKREDVLIVRTDSGTRKFYNIDLRSGTLFLSPGFQLQPNDIVYVGPNNKKIRNLRNNNPNQKGLQIFLGLTTIVSALIFLIANISK